MHYREFRNSDPPKLVDVWRSSPPSRRLVQPLTSNLLEELVLAKPYFDPAGLIVAEDEEEGRTVGFVHAGFGPNDSRTGLNREEGAICMLIVRSEDGKADVASELLARGEDYLRQSGAKEIYAGGVGAICPFYLGLYGGSELPGVPDSQPASQGFFQRHGYVEADRVLMYQCEPGGFRAVIDRSQMQIRRNTTVAVIEDTTARNWWEACTMGCFQQIRVELQPRGGGAPIASARFWCMDPFSQSWGVHAVGLVNVEVSEGQRKEGLATYLLGESIRQLQERGYTLVEGHAVQSNVGAIALIEKLGFTQTDAGSVLRKS